MSKNTIGPVLMVVTLIAVILAIGFAIAKLTSSTTTVITTNGRGGTSNADAIALGSTLNVGGIFTLGTNGGVNGDSGWNGGVGRQEQVSVQYCGGSGLNAYSGYSTTYAASSTQFAVNPYYGSGTSTATVISISATGQATSTDLLVGTSTQSTGVGRATMTPVVASTTIATSSKYFFAPGTPGMSSAGPASSNVRTIQVSPTEYLVGFATTTYNTATNYSQGLACTVKILFSQ